MKSRAAAPMTFEICILAGGLSSRMGRDKTRIHLGRTTLLSRIKSVAQATQLPVRIIRRDIVKPCGPLGGIYTALRTTKFDSVIFLACDMPFVTPDLLLWLRQKFQSRTNALFTTLDDTVGFPFIIQRSLIDVVQEQINTDALSLHALAKRVKAKIFHPPASFHADLFNINTPVHWEEARERLRETRKKQSA